MANGRREIIVNIGETPPRVATTSTTTAAITTAPGQNPPSVVNIKSPSIVKIDPSTSKIPWNQITVNICCCKNEGPTTIPSPPSLSLRLMEISESSQHMSQSA